MWGGERGMKSEMLNNQIKRYDWVIEGILCIMCSNLACLLFFYNNHFISMFTLYICISFKNLVKNEGGEISP